VPTTTVVAVQVNDGSAQRSEVRSITTTFSDPVMFNGGTANAAAAFHVRRVADGTSVAVSAAVATDGLGRTVVTLTFSAGTGTDPTSALNGGVPSLADGRYSLTIIAGDVLNHAFQPLDGDADGVPGGNYVSPDDPIDGGSGELHLYRLFGDATGDGIVDQTDLGQFRSTFNAGAGNPLYISYLDVNNDNVVDQTDLGQFRVRFNVNVWALGAPPSFFVTAGARRRPGRRGTSSFPPLPTARSWAARG